MREDRGVPQRVASFHLVREPAHRAPLVVAALGADRPALNRVPGLEFWRLLGAGRGRDTGAGSVDPARSALFAVWRDAAALEAFTATSRIARRWAAAAHRGGESWQVRLALRAGHGRWGGRDVLAGLQQAGDAGAPQDGPVAVLTRATVRLRHWRRFAAAGRGLSAGAAAAPGLRALVGVGEAPVGRQATFSIWDSADALTAFAYRGHTTHRDIVRRTRDEAWYGEQLFARFTPVSWSGTWDGSDPLSR